MERKRFTAKRYTVAAAMLNSEVAPLHLIDDKLNEAYNYDNAIKAVSKIAPIIGSADIISTQFFRACLAAAPTLLDWQCLQHVPDFHEYNSIIDSDSYFIYEAYCKDGLLYCSACWYQKNILIGFYECRISSTTGEHADHRATPTGLDLKANVAAVCLVIALFKKFAETESNILPQHKKRELFRCSYLNDLPGYVSLLTCNWFTELHQNNPFFVRGHWRWQPHGPAMSLYKLIWINTYTKGGYHAQAQKDKEAAA